MKIFEEIIGPLVTFLVVTISLVLISTVEIRWFVAPILGIISALICYFLLRDGENSVSINTRSSIFKFFRTNWVVLLFLSMIAAYFLIPYNNNILYAEWFEIGLFGGLRFFASLIIVFFLPGYLIITIFANRLPRLAKIVVSYLVSQFIIIFLSLLLFNIGLVSNGTVALSVIALDFVLLFFSVFYHRLLNKSSREPTSPLKISLEQILLCCIVVFFLVVSIATRSSMLHISDLDSWRRLTFSLAMPSGEFPFYIENLDFLALQYPWGGDISLFAIMDVAKLPPINSVMLMGTLDVIPILAFFLLVKSLTNSNKLSIISTTIWSLFSSFGWIWALHIKNVTNTNWIDVLTETNIRFSPPYQVVDRLPGLYNIIIDPYMYYLVSITCILVLLYLSTENRINKTGFICLASLVAVTGYLFHIAEIVMLCSIFPFLAMLAPVRFIKALKQLSISLIFAMLLVYLVEVMSPGSLYTGTAAYTVTFAAAFISALIVYVREKQLLANYQLSIPSFTSNLVFRIFLSFCVCYLLFLSVLVWCFTNPYVPVNTHYDVSAGLFPWFLYPLKFGVAGIVAICCICYLLLKKRSVGGVKFLLLFSLLLFVFGKGLTYFNSTVFFTGYWENRFTTFVFMGCAVLAALGIVLFSDWIKKEIAKGVVKEGRLVRVTSYKRLLIGKAVVPLLIGLLLFSGFAQTLLAVDFVVNINPEETIATETELEAVNYLRLNRPSNSFVLTLTQESLNLLRYFGGVTYKAGQVENLANLTDPEQVFLALMHPHPTFDIGPVKYIYLGEPDLKLLEENENAFLSHFLNYLPVVFSNEAVSIYEVPSSPSIGSGEISLINQGFPDYDLHSILGLSGISYQTSFVQDTNWKESNTVVLSDINPLLYTADWSDIQTKFKDARDGNLNADAPGSTLNVELVNGSTGTWFYYGISLNSSLSTLDGRYLTMRIRTTENTLWSIRVGNPYFDPTLREFSDFGYNVFSSSGKCQWKTVTLDLYELIGIKNYSVIAVVGMLDSGSTGLIEVDSIELSRFSNTMSPETFSSLIGYAENGGRLVVLDSHGEGIFADLLQIDSDIDTHTSSSIRYAEKSFNIQSTQVRNTFSLDSEVEEVSHYFVNGELFPFIYTKKIGAGEINYCIIQPILSATHFELGNITNLFSSLLGTYKTENNSDLTGISYTGFAASDEVSLESNYFRLNGGIKFESLSIEGQNISCSEESVRQKDLPFTRQTATWSVSTSPVNDGETVFQVGPKTDSLEIQVNTTNNGQLIDVYYSFQEPEDWTNVESISLMLKSKSSLRVSMAVYTLDNNGYWFTLSELNGEEWNEQVIIFDDNTQKQLGAVSFFFIRFYANPQESHDLTVKNLALEVKELTNLSNLTRFGSSGGQINSLVANGPTRLAITSKITEFNAFGQANYFKFHTINSTHALLMSECSDFTIDLNNETSRSKICFKGGQISLIIQNFEGEAGAPTSINGNHIQLPCTYITIPGSLHISNMAATVNGSILALHSLGDAIIYTNLIPETVSQEITIGPSFEEWQLPWIPVLTSVYNYSFIVLFVIVTSVVAILKRKKLL